MKFLRGKKLRIGWDGKDEIEYWEQEKRKKRKH